MKHLVPMLFFVGLACCASPPREQLARAGFTSENVIVARILDRRSGKTSGITQEQSKKIMRALDGIGNPKAPMDEPQYVMTILKGSSFENHKLNVFLSDTGEGCFQQGNGREVKFFSRELLQLMKMPRPVLQTFGEPEVWMPTHHSQLRAQSLFLEV